MKPLISIVIPTKNSARTLRLCLESVYSQTFRDFEVIMVDAFSDDGTREIAREYGVRFMRSRASLPGARNLGFSRAKGDVFVSIDSDMVLEPAVMGDIAARIKEFDVLIIPEIGYGDDFISRCKDLEKRCYIGDPVIEAARAFRREAFLGAAGYDPALHFGEDWDLHQRVSAGKRIGRVPSRIMHNTVGVSMVSDLKKAYLYGRTSHRYFAKKPPQASRWLTVRQFFFFKNFGKLRREPVHALGLAAIKGSEYAAGILGYLSAR